MAGKSAGTVFVDLDLDASRYTKAMNQLLANVKVVALDVESNFRTLGIKSSAHFDLLKAQAINAYEGIKHSANATANDIVRAEQAKNAKLADLQKQQFGTQTSLLSDLKSHWLAATAVMAVAAGTAMKVWSMAKVGAAYDEQRGMLDNLAAKYKTTADAIVDEMDRASKFQIAKSELMQIALGGIAKGLNPEQLINLANAAETLGDAVGKDATTALKDLTEALETGRTKGLKNYLGATLDLESAFGDLVSKMTAAEKSQAMYNITMIAAIDIQNRQNKETDDAADKIAQIEKKYDDATLAASRFFKTIVVGMLDVGSASKSPKGSAYTFMPETPGERPGSDYAAGPGWTAAASTKQFEDANKLLKDQLQLRNDLKKVTKEAAEEEKSFIKEIEKLSLEAQKTIEQGDTNQWKNMEKLLDVRKREEEQAAEDRMKMYRKLGEEEEKSWEFIPTKIKESTDEWQTAISGWANGFSRDLNDAVWDADFSFSKIAQSFAKMITQMVIQTKIIQPMLRKLFELDSSSSFDWVGSILKLGGSMAGGASESTAAGLSGEGFLTAHGAVFDNGLVPFASGGVVSGPKIFQFAGGVGMMGENGPEAIMPLTRTRTGDLGVKSAGGGGLKVEIHNYNESQIRTEATPDGSTLRVFVERVALDTMRKNTGAVAEAWNSEARGGNKALRNTIRRLS